MASAKELIQTCVDDRLCTGKNHHTVTLSIPQPAVGKVIGRQGANIKSIQRESGAKVSMSVLGCKGQYVRTCSGVQIQYNLPAV